MTAAVTPLSMPPRPPRHLQPVRPERVWPPETLVGYWNHRCDVDACPTWVPNHRTTCTTHEGDPR